MSLRDYLLDCPWKKHLGIDCPGCGFQRSVVLLTEGKLSESISMYPATIPILAMLLFLLAHLKFKFQRGGQILKYLFILSAIIIVTNYITKHFL